MTLNKKAAIFVLALLPLGSVHAINTPNAKAIPGGIAIVELGPSTDRPVARFGDKPVLVIPHKNKARHWKAITGIPLDSKPGRHQLDVSTAAGNTRVSFKVKDKKYKKQYLKIKNKRKVNPNKKDMERIIREKKEIEAALSHFREAPTLSKSFQIPVKGRLSSPFGLRRFFNKQPRKPHSGIDIAAALGTAIVSPAEAVVLKTGDFFFNGNTVFLDHGNGLITMYCHMNKITVKEGQKIDRGQKIGSIGKTGRVTGPHLHWAVSLNDARVDPGMFFTNLKKQVRPKKRKP